MLRIPAPGEPTPALVAKTGLNIVPVSLPEAIQRNREKRRQEAESEGAAPETAVSDPSAGLKRRRREAKTEEEPDWEKDPAQRIRVGRRHRVNLGKISAVGLAIACLAGALIFLLRREKPAYEPIARAPEPETILPLQPAEPDPIQLPEQMNRNQTELVAELEPITRKFLEAKSVEEMLPLVRDSDRVESKMRKFYKDGVRPTGLGQFNTTGSVSFRGNLSAVSIRTGDFELRQIAFYHTPAGYKLDWESFVGWSEMPWTEFTEKQPETPVLFRVKASRSDYYNFSFSNDVEWKAYQLRSPDDEVSLYGYVKVGSETDRQLSIEGDSKSALFMVKLRYPTGDKKRNQVLIDSMVADGWVEGLNP